MRKSDIFNSRTINVFTDGSMWYRNKEAIQPVDEAVGCPGAVITFWDDNGELVNEFYYDHIIRNCTNNICELSAILLGVNQLIRFPYELFTVNLFSDSQICINSLTQWVFNWVNSANSEGTIFTSSGDELKNQELIKTLLFTIVNMKLNINFYHQKGHVLCNNYKSFENACHCFKKSNRIGHVDKDIITMISYYNDMVDKKTKYSLWKIKDTIEPAIEMTMPFDFNIKNLDVPQYRKFIGR